MIYNKLTEVYIVFERIDIEDIKKIAYNAVCRNHDFLILSFKDFPQVLQVIFSVICLLIFGLSF